MFSISIFETTDEQRSIRLVKNVVVILVITSSMANHITWINQIVWSQFYYRVLINSLSCVSVQVEFCNRF